MIKVEVRMKDIYLIMKLVSQNNQYHKQLIKIKTIRKKSKNRFPHSVENL